VDADGVVMRSRVDLKWWPERSAYALKEVLIEEAEVAAAFLSPYLSEDGAVTCLLSIRFDSKHGGGGALCRDGDDPGVPFPRCGRSSVLTTNQGGLGSHADGPLGLDAEPATH
jgi:hypothetical protein